MLSKTAMPREPGLVPVFVYHALIRLAIQVESSSNVSTLLQIHQPTAYVSRWSDEGGVVVGSNMSGAIVDAQLIGNFQFERDTGSFTRFAAIDASLLHELMVSLPTGNLPEVMPQAFEFLPQLNLIRMLALFKHLKREDNRMPKAVRSYCNFSKELFGEIDIAFFSDESILQILFGDEAWVELRY